MDPYAKAFKVSVTLHVVVAATFLVGTIFGDIFHPKPAAVFTVLGPPAGLIAGGPSTSDSRTAMPDMTPIPQGPRLPSPTPAPATPEKVHPMSAVPEDNFMEAVTKPKPRPSSDNGVLRKHKTKVTPKVDTDAQKISYSDWQRKFAPKKPTAKDKTPNKAQKTSDVVPSSGVPSFEENLASRLNRKMQEQGDSSVGTGLGDAAGSGEMGNGIAGATMDVDAVYSGTIYTYLNSVWEEPREVGNVHMTARVEFTVDHTGAIKGWTITRRSGSDSFDKSVEKVFSRVKQVSAPPSNQDYRLTVNFETRDS